MEKTEIWNSVNEELKKSRKKLPSWPDHICGQGGLVSEESGKLVGACVQWKYKRNDTPEGQGKQREEIKEAALQVIVLAYRLLENLD